MRDHLIISLIVPPVYDCGDEVEGGTHQPHRPSGSVTAAFGEMVVGMSAATSALLATAEETKVHEATDYDTQRQ